VTFDWRVVVSSQVISEIEKRGHEQVVVFNYPEVGLKAIVAIHSTVLGPALGGCRMRLYENEAQAIDDVLRLSEGMTYKNSIAGLNLGGGKSCIVADPAMKQGREALFSKFAECLNDLRGRYITAEDMGTCESDMLGMRKLTQYASGYPVEHGGGGDPSPWTALGVFHSIRAACGLRYGSEDLNGRTVAIQGVGNVGMVLAEHLAKAGAKLVVCDPTQASLEKAKERFGATVVTLDAIYDAKCDVFAPCAIGQTVNKETLSRLSCDIICGAANNQLPDSSVYNIIQKQGIDYCPDFVVNSGGVICVGAEHIEGGWNKAWVQGKVDAIYGTTTEVMTKAKKAGVFPEVTALEMARDRVRKAAEQK
jgi:leucine dehydrogenase